MTFQSIPYTIEKINLGVGALTVTKNTIAQMHKIIIEESTNPYVRKWAEYIIQSLPDKNKIQEAEQIMAFVQDHVRYVNDPRGDEYVQKPEYLLRQIEVGMVPQGDCDDMTVLSLTLLKSIGFRTAMRVVEYNHSGKFTHVYGMVYIPNHKWEPMDAINKVQSLGWEHPNKTRQMDILVDK